MVAFLHTAHVSNQKNILKVKNRYSLAGSSQHTWKFPVFRSIITLIFTNKDYIYTVLMSLFKTEEEWWWFGK